MRLASSTRRRVYLVVDADEAERYRSLKAEDIQKILDGHIVPKGLLNISSLADTTNLAEHGVEIEVISSKFATADVIEYGAPAKKSTSWPTFIFLKDHSASKALDSATNFLDNVALILPSRIVNEDLGDFLEDINRRASQGQSPLKICVRTAAATFWLMVNTVGYLARTIGARKSA